MHESTRVCANFTMGCYANGRGGAGGTQRSCVRSSAGLYTDDRKKQSAPKDLTNIQNHLVHKNYL